MSAVLQNTPVEAIPQIVENLRSAFATGKTRSVEYRKKQLKQLYFLIHDNEKAFVEAIRKDLGRPAMETVFGEVISIKNEIVDTVKNLDKWAKPTTVKAGAAYMLHTTQINKDPKGTVLVMGAWNYPITVQIGPMVSAIAAGNTTVLKPSELSANCAQLIADLWPKYMDPETTVVVNGAIDQSTAILDQRFEHIFYTGSGNVGRIVAAKASKWLCPVSLELGGKSPVIIDHTADLKIAAHRVLWAKLYNTGQTCVAPDYILIERSIQDRFAAELVQAAKEYWPSMTKDVRDFGRIVNERHWKRVQSLISQSKGEIVMGGAEYSEESEKFVPLTVLKNVHPDDATMDDEIFGPVLPMVPVDNVREAIDFINARDQPLALYFFTANDATAEYIMTYTRSGSAVRGDMLLQYVINELPFGGTGPSGYGAYHGKHGFDTFSHQRAYVEEPANGILGRVVEAIMSSRYPPYTPRKLALFRYTLSHSAFFGRPKNPNESNTSLDRGVPKQVRTKL
ncbi:hypothetical protein MVES1_002761 [Malassezia vespertilionis]|uniref:Aldehyde dehydrogenase n=1 Tax=Malassezia vespertilionis TaxID=2020962 RepID=A0A2N1JAU3_9BASI|nr:uncharacterized protein MVES1_002761 [Malassezia vespertilionis]PKI83653.1 hypothetical protein MVES_002610 [Malassezia vespertilionis]WFD07397.1 hypothetical protein MVES1_002761 [Malassezia vespertilionis]